MKPGQVLEYAIWLDGRESPEQRKQFEHECHVAMQRAGENYGVLMSPVRLTEKNPGDDRVTASVERMSNDQPQHRLGMQFIAYVPENTKLIVANGRVIGVSPGSAPFIVKADGVEPIEPYVPA